MKYNILLINPSTMQTPPVPPIGLEFIADVLKKEQHNVTVLDLCFSENPEEDLINLLRQKKFDLAGLTIRNIDSAIYYNNEFFLPAFKKLVDILKNKNIPVVLGGAGFSAMPGEVLNYLNADYGIIGPAEKAFPFFLKHWKESNFSQTIINGWDHGLDIDVNFERGRLIDYQKYFKEGALAGFTTSTGCLHECPYCIEANTPLLYRNIEIVLKDIQFLAQQGFNNFHLCDSEFNLNLNYCKQFLKKLVQKKIDISWTLYMKVAPYDEELFQLLKYSNANLITFSVDTSPELQNLNAYDYNDLIKVINYAKQYGIEIAIDLSTGYINENIESLKKAVQLFKQHRPKSVGIVSIYRVYPNTILADQIRKNPELQKSLIFPYGEDFTFLKPAFFQLFNRQEIEDIIEGDDIFKRAGVTPGVNYQL